MEKRHLHPMFIVVLSVATLLFVMIPVVTVVIHIILREHAVHEGTAVVLSGSSFEMPFRVYYDDVEVRYRFSAANSLPVDVYILTPDGYMDYRGGRAPDGYRYENVISFSRSPYFSHGDYWVVIDNTDYGGAKADGRARTVDFYVDAGRQPPGDTNWMAVAFVVLSAMAAVTGLGYALFRPPRADTQGVKDERGLQGDP